MTTLAMFGKTLNLAQEDILGWWLGNDDARVIQLLGGERAGKSFLAALLAVMSMDINTPDEYWAVGPDYLQARPEFTYIYEAFRDGYKGISFVKPESVSMPVNIASPWSFETIWGQVWRTKSASDVQKLASFKVRGALMTEAAQQIYEAYLKLLGRIMETNGFLILSGTLERGLPWYADLYTRWQGDNELNARSFSLPTWSNTAVFPGGREDPKIKMVEAEYPEDLFLERFAAIPARKQGLVIPEFDIKKHVKKLTFNPKLPVELAIDPGQHCYAVLFVQSDGLTTHVLDAVYKHGIIAQDVIPMVLGNPLWKAVDLQHAGVIDNAGKQHMANKSQIELWQEIGHATLRAEYRKLDDTIQTVRFRLRDYPQTGLPLVFFNSHFTNSKGPNGIAKDILAEFELWHWPDRGNNRNMPISPVDRNNDAIKALGYYLLDRYGTNVLRKSNPRGRRRDYFI